MSHLTRSACKTMARFQLNEPVARFYTESAMNDWADGAVRDISLRTFCVQHICSPVNTTTGVSAYAFPILLGTATIACIGVKTVLDSSGVSMGYITPDLLGKISENQDERKWTVWGESVIISPTPGTAVKTLTFLVWGEARQTAAGTITLPDVYHHLVPLYMVYKGHEAKRNFVSADKVFKEYEDEITRILQILHGSDNPATNLKPGTPAQTVST